MEDEVSGGNETEPERNRLYARCPARVKLVEVGPRDGLQNEPAPVPTERKIAFIEALADAGHTHIEVSSFVRPDRVPQLADAAEVFGKIRRRPEVTYTALVPNARGLERALECGVRSIAVLTAASDTFNQRNLGCGTAESLERIREVAARASAERLEVRAYISTAFVCPYEGAVRPETVVDLASALGDLGIERLSIGDTIGAAYPDGVSRLLEALERERPLDGVALHLHDTYRRALPNALAGLLHGVSEFDASAGGLGGCPFAPGAAGNVATEELIDFLEGQGISTGVDREGVRRALAELGLAGKGGEDRRE